MRWVRGLLVAAGLAAPALVVVLVAWPSSGTERREAREEGSGPDGSLVVGDTVRGELGFGEVATYVAIGDGSTLRFDVRGAPGFDATLTALDDDGDQLAYNDDTNGLDPQVVVEVAEGDEITVEVRELGGTAGAYTLDVTND